MAPPHESDRDRASDPAPWFKIPNKQYICIEHPAKIQNVDRAVTTIGGERALAKLVETNGESGLELRLRPEDPFQHPIRSRTAPTNNVLLKISIPKCKRKRRTRTELANQSENISSAAGRGVSTEAQLLYDKLVKSNGNYRIEALGTVSTTVRFRDIADYQYSTMQSEFAKKFVDNLLDCTYENIKKFNLDPDESLQHADLPPPPLFSRTVIPHLYHYHQNPAIKRAIIDGQATLLNIQAAPKTLTAMVQIDTTDIPTSPPENLPDLSIMDDFTRSCVERLRSLFAERPIWTRRALVNNFPAHLHPMIRFSMVHVAYMWRAGPWRDTCVSYGVDPRTDPKYRQYQSLFFQFEVDSEKKSRDNRSHIFDGKTLVKDGRCFQLCDITDPILRNLIDREKLRKTCHPRDGWYRSGTMIKIKGVMREKIRALVEDDAGPESNERIASILEESSDEDEEGNQNPKNIGKQRKKKTERRAALSKQAESRTADTPDIIEGELEDEDEAEEGAAALESEWTSETIDRKVNEFMLELMKQGNDQGEMDDYHAPQGGFDILEASSEDEA